MSRLGSQLSLSLIALLSLAACDDPPTPEASLRAFIAAAAAGDQERAWKGLSRETREAAQALVDGSREALVAAGEVPPRDGKALLFGHGLEMVRGVQSIDELSRTDDRAHLRVTDPEGNTVEMEMRFEAGAWKLHLPLNDG